MDDWLESLFGRHFDFLDAPTLDLSVSLFVPGSEIKVSEFASAAMLINKIHRDFRSLNVEVSSWELAELGLGSLSSRIRVNLERFGITPRKIIGAVALSVITHGIIGAEGYFVQHVFGHDDAPSDIRLQEIRSIVLAVPGQSAVTHEYVVAADVSQTLIAIKNPHRLLPDGSYIVFQIQTSTGVTSLKIELAERRIRTLSPATVGTR